MKRFLTAMMALSCVLTIGACGAGTPQTDEMREAAALVLWDFKTTSDEARQQIADGMRAIDFNGIAEGYEHFERAIAIEPSAMAELGAAWASPGPEAYFAHLNKAVALSAGDNEVIRTLVQVYQKQVGGDPEGALALAKKLADLTPENGRSRGIVGDIHDAIGDHEQARVNWLKAIELAPNLATLYFFPSVSYSQIEPMDLAKAEVLARKAVELEPDEQFAHDNLGDAFRAQGKLDEAAAAYTKAAELDPTKGGGLQQRGHVNTFLGRYAEARADYDAAVALSVGDAKPRLAMYRAFVHLHEGNEQAALAELDALIRSVDGMNVPDPVGIKAFITFPQLNIATHFKMAAEAERYGASLEALLTEQAAQTKSEEFTRQARATKELIRALVAFAKGDHQSARAGVEEYTKIRAQDKNLNKMRPVHGMFGMIALDEKRYADAVEELAQADLDNIYFVYQYGVALEGAGKPAEAQTQYQKVANFYFSNEGAAMVRKAALAKIKAIS